MTISDHKYVNFSEDYEMNYILRKFEKSQSIQNRSELRIMGDELKISLGTVMLTHAQFHPYVGKNLERLGD